MKTEIEFASNRVVLRLSVFVVLARSELHTEASLTRNRVWLWLFLLLRPELHAESKFASNRVGLGLSNFVLSTRPELKTESELASNRIGLLLAIFVLFLSSKR